VFNVNYLGGNMPTFSLNFSRPGSEVVAQYFMFLALGHQGFTDEMRNMQAIAVRLSAGVAEIGPYRLISDGSQLPVFAFALQDSISNYTVFDVSEHLRERGWLVPAYTFPENRQDLSVLRIVVRAGMHMDMAEQLLDALRDKTAQLQALDGPLPRSLASTTQAFAH
jgi:glutamate decarboxylase